jgi:hypothetical protein
MALTDQEIIEAFIAIKGSPVVMCGNMATCPNPEHPDTLTPSCVVDRQTGKFFCYGCWAEGTVGEPWTQDMIWVPPPPPKENEARMRNERWVPHGSC